jgi:DNA-binding NtrC family response regulator
MQRRKFIAYRRRWGCVVAAILVVEDEEQVRVLAESFLQTAGHSTLSAGSIEQALALLGSPEPIDLLFIDLNLKGESEAGLSLAVQAAEMRPELKVLYTSGQAVTDGMSALFVKSSAFLPKPYTIEQLGTMLSLKFDLRSSAKPHAGDGDDRTKQL